jgi:hypothetical protein
MKSSREVKAAATLAERERIIKLLITKKESMIANASDAKEIWGIGMAIALIRIKADNE